MPDERPRRRRLLSPNEQDFINACVVNDLDYIEEIISRGFNVDFVDERGRSPLFVVCQYGHQQLAEKLLNAGADPNRLDISDITPLHLASSNNSSLVVVLLLRYVVDINVTDLFGCTPLSDACKDSYLEIIDLLLGNGSLDSEVVICALTDHFCSMDPTDSKQVFVCCKLTRWLQLNANDKLQEWLSENDLKLNFNDFPVNSNAEDEFDNAAMLFPIDPIPRRDLILR